MKPYFVGLAIMVLLLLVSIFFGIGDIESFLITFAIAILLVFLGVVKILIKYKLKIVLLILFASLLVLSFLAFNLSSMADFSLTWYFYAAVGISITFIMYYLIKLWKLEDKLGMESETLAHKIFREIIIAIIIAIIGYGIVWIIWRMLHPSIYPLI